MRLGFFDHPLPAIDRAAASGPPSIIVSTSRAVQVTPPFEDVTGGAADDLYGDCVSPQLLTDDLRYLLLAGRTGTANDAFISTTGIGTITGSRLLSGGGLALHSNIPGTGTVFVGGTVAPLYNKTDGSTPEVAVDFSPTFNIDGTGIQVTALRSVGTWTSTSGFAAQYGVNFSPTIQTNLSWPVLPPLTGINIEPTFDAHITTFMLFGEGVVSAPSYNADPSASYGSNPWTSFVAAVTPDAESAVSQFIGYQHQGNLGAGSVRTQVAFMAATTGATDYSAGLLLGGISGSPGAFAVDEGFNTKNSFLSRSVFGAYQATPSSNAAGLELQSTTRTILFSRLTSTQESALDDPQDGSVYYNTERPSLRLRLDDEWVDLATEIDLSANFDHIRRLLALILMELKTEKPNRQTRNRAQLRDALRSSLAPLL